MLPITAWPPSSPGSSLSPFGAPRAVNVGFCATFGGYRLPKGAWVVTTTANQVLLYKPKVQWANIGQAPGSGLVPGAPDPTPSPGWQWPNTLTPSRAGAGPPNFFGWFPAPGWVNTLIGPNATGTVFSDGQNVVITGSGNAYIMQVYSA